MTLAISPEVYTSMGLNEGEYRRILELLGRDPLHTELAMFAVMWSEHCGYKYSRPVLSLFKKYKEAMEGDGLENAGIVDIGEGLGVTMKIESHNHPSAVEPYQGAATGVGGIIRDILTMGARPIAGLNSLRFGPIEETKGVSSEVIERNRYLFEHVVAGVGGYGNCVGVPTVGGEVGFHPRYSGNPLVNAMCVGLLKLDEITTAGASGAGNPVIYLGSATGRDGIHGATFASDALGEDNDAKRPNVQIGDPFAEKQLIEATLEALQTGAVVAIQDMGAAGLTCSTIEMASKGDVGMSINLDLVPMREADMTAHDLMLSESQERMLAVAYKGRENEVISVFRKWGIKAEIIGHVTDDGNVTVTRFGEVAASVDPKLLTDYCPTYTTPKEEPEYFKKAGRFDPNSLPITDLRESLLKLLESPEIASKRWVFRQYDQHVQTQTILSSGQADAAVLWPRGTKKGLAIKVDGNERQVYLHPYRGGKLAVAEAARNVACTGAMPVAVTDGLNFGNPQYPHVYWQFSESVRGIAEAAEIMHTPVISGNVSFYNESDLGEILPTPLIGMLGILEDAEKAIGSTPEGAGPVWLVYSPQIKIEQQGLGASAYAALVHGVEDGYPEDTSIDAEHRLCKFLSEAVSKGLLTFAHDLSAGGLAVAAAEVCAGQYGAKLDLDHKAFDYATSPEAVWFGEVPARVLVGPASDGGDQIKALAKAYGLEVAELGHLDETGVFQVKGTGFNPVEITKTELQRGYLNRIESLMTHPV